MLTAPKNGAQHNTPTDPLYLAIVLAQPEPVADQRRDVLWIVGAELDSAIPIAVAPVRRVEHHPGHYLRHHPVPGGYAGYSVFCP